MKKIILGLVYVAFLFGFSTVALASNAGPNNAQTGMDVSGVGTVTWSNPNRIIADDTSYATANLGVGTTSHYIQGTNYGFSIPSSATINGIKVEIRRSSSLTNRLIDNTVNLIKADSIVGDNNASGTDWPSSMATATYGGSSDLWGTTWTPEEINASNFGVALSAKNTSSSNPRIASIDFIQVTVSYKLNQVIAVDTHAPATAVYRSTFPVGATVDSGSSVIITTTGNCSGIGLHTATITMTSGTGSCVVHYNRPGNTTTYNAAPEITEVVNAQLKDLTVSGITASSKIYDNTIDALLNTSGATLVGNLDGGNVVLNTGSASGSFADENVGNGKVVTVSGLSISGSKASNYSLIQPTTTADITVKDLTVYASGNNKIYNGSASATVTLSTDAFGGDDVTANYTNASFADLNVANDIVVAVTGISISGADASNYNLLNTTADTKANITRATLTPSVSASSKTYDGNNTATITNCSLSRIIGTDDVSCSVGSAVFNDKTANVEKTVTASSITLGGAGASNYVLSSDTATTLADILKKDITVVAVGVSKLHDGNTDATVSLSSPDIISGDSVTLSYGSASFDDSDVGADKPIHVSGISIMGADAPNYNLINTIATTKANIVQNPANITLDTSNLIRTYNGAPQEVSVVATDPASLSYVVFYNGSTVVPTNAGTYTVFAVISDPNYAGTTSATLVINKAPLSIVADSKTKNYSESDPVLTYTVTSGTLFEGDTLSGALVREAGENVGVYAISKGTLTNDNYDISFEGSNLTINKADQVINFSPIENKVYEDEDFKLNAEASSGLGLSFSTSGPCSVSSDMIHITGVGHCEVTASQLGNENHNEAVSVMKSFDINAKPITITAKNGQSKVYGDSNPILTYESSDTDATFTGILDRTSGENVGAYPINQGTLAVVGENYTISSFIPADFTITKAPLKIKAISKTKVYHDADPIFDALYIGLKNEDGSSSAPATLLRVAGENVGSYVINVFGASNSNYEITYESGTLTITKFGVTVTANSQSKEYGHLDPVLTYTNSPLVGNDLLTGVLNRAEGENLGKHAINQGTLSAGDNYAITFIPSDLTIVDTTAPVITILGENPIRLAINSTYEDAGATVTDNHDKEIELRTSGSVDTTTPGEYTITYSATDSSENSTTVTRIVTVNHRSGGGVSVFGSSYDNFNPTTISSNTNPNDGIVLGAEIFKFNKNLRLGSRGNDVSELQKRLTSEGFYTGKITGYFGPLTKTAVKLYQVKHGLKSDGSVGPKTRDELNK